MSGVQQVLEVVKQRGAQKEKDEWRFSCPSHQDEHPSARFHPGKGVWVCDACRDGGGYKDLAKKLGITLSQNGASKITKTYSYLDEEGNELYQVVRLEPKTFRQRRKVGGQWVWKLGNTRRVLYHLPEIRKAEPHRVIFLVEGEKDADNLRELGVYATTNPQGANKWRDEYSEQLADRHVAIVPDNDEAGQQHAKRVAKNLTKHAKSIRILQLPDLPDKGDVSDWIRAGGTKEKLEQLVKAAPRYDPQDESEQEPERAPPLTSIAGVIERDTGYVIERENHRGNIVKAEPVTNWILAPTLRLTWPDGRTGERSEILINERAAGQIELPADAWNSRKDLLSHLGPYGAVCFTSSNSDIARIKQYLLTQHTDLPTAKGVNSYGLHKHDQEWLELFENECITTQDTTPLFYAGVPVDPGSHAHKSPKIGTPDEIQAAKEAIKQFHKLITPAAAFAILGYATASAFSPRITPHLGNRLPFVYLAGEREAGKTSGAQIGLELSVGHSSARMHKASGMTNYQYDLAFSNANNLLALLDEFRPGELDDAQFRKHHDLAIKWRGTGLASKDHAYLLNSPMIVLGEGFTEDAAALSRGVLYFVDKKDRGDLKHYTHTTQQPIWAYAHYLHTLARTTPDPQHHNVLEHAQKLASAATKGFGGPRLTYALTYIAYGLITLQNDIDADLYRDEVIHQTLRWGVNHTLEGGTESMTNLERFLEQLGATLIESKNPKAVLATTASDKEIIIRISSAVELVNQKYRKQSAITNARLLRRYASGVEWVSDTTSTHRDEEGNVIRGLKINLEEVPERCDTEALKWLERKMRSNNHD